MCYMGQVKTACGVFLFLMQCFCFSKQEVESSKRQNVTFVIVKVCNDAHIHYPGQAGFFFFLLVGIFELNSCVETGHRGGLNV